MRRVLWFAGAVALVSCGALLEYYFRPILPRMQPKIAIISADESSTKALTGALSEACPQAAYTAEKGKEDSDYRVALFWNADHWSSFVTRRDGAVVLFPEDPQYTGSDYKIILRRICNALVRDASLWAADQTFRSQIGAKVNRGVEWQSSSADRFEIRDLRNGPVVSTALVDRKSGRVWVWKTGAKESSAFFEEDVIPKPDN